MLVQVLERKEQDGFFSGVYSDFELLQLEFTDLDFTLKELRFSQVKFPTESGLGTTALKGVTRKTKDKDKDINNAV